MRPPRRRAALRVAAGLPAALVALAVAAAIAGCGSAGSSTDQPATGEPCQGVPRLCGRRLDQVIFPATHNSYAASDQPGWHFASQTHGIARQLDDGIRALLLDVHYGIPDPATGLVRTDLRAEGSDRNKVRQALPAPALALADRLAGRIGAPLPPGRPRPYLCHTLCELGADPLIRELKAIHAFLAAHPREVLILIVEDYVPPATIARSFAAAGLTDTVARLDRGSPPPTLGHLLDTGRHLVVFAEKDGGSPPWYQPAFGFIADTPLGAHRPSQLSCARFRGEADSPLLLINHWIPPFPPSPRLNAAIGSAPFLRRRIERCLAERGAEGAIVAVDFYERGAVVRVAAELNRADG